MLHKLLQIPLQSIKKIVLSLEADAQWDLLTELIWSVRGGLYAGNSRLCNICGWKFRRFLDESGTSRCPRCSSRPRNRWMHWFLEHHHFSNPFQSVLHVSPPLTYKKRIPNWGLKRYVSMDIVDVRVDIHTDLKNTSFRDDSFDLILCSHVLEHLQEDQPAIRELKRILSEGGTLIVLVPYDPELSSTREARGTESPEERNEKFGDPTHWRQYGRDLPNRLEEAGFEVEERVASAEVDSSERETLRIPTDERIFVGSH